MRVSTLFLKQSVKFVNLSGFSFTVPMFLYFVNKESAFCYILTLIFVSAPRRYFNMDTNKVSNIFNH